MASLLLSSAARRSARVTTTQLLLPQQQQRMLFSTQQSREMKIIETVAEFHAARKQLPSSVSVGLVPTMGVSKSSTR